MRKTTKYILTLVTLAIIYSFLVPNQIYACCQSGHYCTGWCLGGTNNYCVNGGCLPNPTNTPVPPTPRPTTPPPPVNTPAPGNNQCQYNACVGNRCETQTVGLCNGGGCGCYSNQCSDGDHGACGGGNTPTPTPIPLTSIKGHKSLMPGNIYDTATKVSAMEILRDDANPTTDNPYSYDGLSPGDYKISAAQPDVNYLVGYTKCDNSDTCHNGSQPYTFIPQTMPVTPASVTFNAPPTYVSLWWHYWEYAGWYRFKNVSFHKQGGIQNYIPWEVNQYDGFDTDEEFLNVHQATEPSGVGIVTSTASIDLGPEITNVSQKNWSKSQYDIADKGYLGDLTAYLGYIKARKNFQVVTSLAAVEADSINIFEGDVSINNYNFMSGKNNVVIFATGNITIANILGGVFNDPSDGVRESVAFISQQNIIIGPDMTEVGAILIGNNIDFAGGAETSTKPLKITGNVISNNPIADIKRYRPADQYRQASLYLVFFPQFYIDLMPHLSTVLLEGREIL